MVAFGRGAWVVCAVLGCAAPAVTPGSNAETQLHAHCPTSGVCAEPLTCVSPEETGERGTCELTCTDECPLPMVCAPRTDGRRGGVCTSVPRLPRPLSATPPPP